MTSPPEAPAAAALDEHTSSPGPALGIAAALTLAALVYDPRAEAAEPKRVLFLVIAAIALSIWLARPRLGAPLGWGARFGLLFVALSGLSLTWGLAPGARDLGTWCAALGGAVLARGFGAPSARQVVRLSALAIGGGASAVALVCAASGASGMQLHAGQGNPNWLGLLLAVTLPLSLDATLPTGSATRGWRAVAITVSAAHVPALYLSHSRVGWFAAGVACTFLLAKASLRRPRRAALAVAGSGLAAVALLLSFAAGTLGSKGDVPVAEALAGRAWIWRHSAQAALEAFPLGAGLGRFGHVYLDAQGRALAQLTPGQAARRFTHATTAHNEYLQVAAESGALTALALAAALLCAAGELWRRGWLGEASALGACLLTSLADSPLRQPAIAVLIGLLLGLPCARAAPCARRPAQALAALALLALTAFLLQDATRAWLSTRQRTLARDADPRDHLARLAKSTRLDPASGAARFELGLARLQAGDARGALDELERADRSFADVGTRLAIGAAHLTLADGVGAERAFDRAKFWNFGSFRARLGRAEALFQQQRLDEAEREAASARKLMPGEPRGRALLDAIREAQMDR